MKLNGLLAKKGRMTLVMNSVFVCAAHKFAMIDVTDRAWRLSGKVIPRSLLISAD
jgi:hypothetical protein